MASCPVIRGLRLLFDEILPQHGGLNAGVPLVFAGLVTVVVAADGVVEDLADAHAGVDAHGLDAADLQGPEAAEADVAEARGDMDEEPQTTHAAAALQHGHHAVRLRVFQSAPEVESPGFQQQALRGDFHELDAVGLGHVEFTFSVDGQIVAQAQVVAVGIQLIVPPGVDADPTLVPGFEDLFSGENHRQRSTLRTSDLASMSLRLMRSSPLTARTMRFRKRKLPIWRRIAGPRSMRPWGFPSGTTRSFMTFLPMLAPYFDTHQGTKNQ